MRGMAADRRSSIPLKIPTRSIERNDISTWQEAASAMPFRLIRSRSCVYISLESRNGSLLLCQKLKQDRRAFLRLTNATLNGRDNLARLGDTFGISTEGVGQFCIVARNVGTLILLCGYFHDRQLDGHGEVVQHNRKDRNAFADSRLKVHASEAYGRVSPHIDA